MVDYNHGRIRLVWLWPTFLVRKYPPSLQFYTYKYVVLIILLALSAGRWFASHIMKMTLAYIALKYEIQHIKDRPANMVIGDVLVPPQNVNIKVRRRR